MTIKAHNLINTPASTTLALPMVSTDTSLTVSSEITISAPFKATFTATGEIIEVGVVSGTTWSNITRGAESTTAVNHASGDKLALLITAGHMKERRPFNVYPSTIATENTLNIRAAIADGYVNMAPGDYPVAQTASETELFLVEKAIEINGHGAKIIVSDSTPITCDVFRFVAKDTFPLFAIEQYGTTMVGSSSGTVGLHVHDLTIRPNTVSSYATVSQHAIHLDLDAASSNWFRDAVFSRLILGAFSGYSLKVSNAAKNDGIWNSTFSDLVCYGGIRVQKGGDSLKFDSLTFRAVPNSIGLDVDLNEGAGLLTINDVNGVCDAGLMKLVFLGNSTTKITNCNMEQYTGTTASTGALVYVSGGQDHLISHNRFIKIFPADVSIPNEHALSLVGCSNSTVIGNQLQGSGTGNDIDIDATSTLSYAPQTSNRCFQNKYSNLGTNRTGI